MRLHGTASDVTLLGTDALRIVLQLDSGLGQLWSSYDGGRTYVLDKATAATNTQVKAKENVLKVVDQAVDVLSKQRATLSAAATSAADSVKTAVEHARSTTEQNTEFALEKVASTWAYLLSFPAGGASID
jgi:hypothetical protein